MNFLRANPAAWVLLILVGMVAGCAENGNPADEGDLGNTVDLTDPLAVLAEHRRTVEHKDAQGYEALLTPDFEYQPQDEDAQDLPWVGPDGVWDVAEELQMIRNMMNPAFISDQTGESVDSIEMNLAVSGQSDVPGGVEVACSADILVLWAQGTGAQSNVRFTFTLLEDEHGELRIRKIVERPESGRSVESTSWGMVKGLYRTGTE